MLHRLTIINNQNGSHGLLAHTLSRPWVRLEESVLVSFCLYHFKVDPNLIFKLATDTFHRTLFKMV